MSFDEFRGKFSWVTFAEDGSFSATLCLFRICSANFLGLKNCERLSFWRLPFSSGLSLVTSFILCLILYEHRSRFHCCMRYMNWIHVVCIGVMSVWVAGIRHLGGWRGWRYRRGAAAASRNRPGGGMGRWLGLGLGLGIDLVQGRSRELTLHDDRGSHHTPYMLSTHIDYLTSRPCGRT